MKISLLGWLLGILLVPVTEQSEVCRLKGAMAPDPKDCELDNYKVRSNKMSLHAHVTTQCPPRFEVSLNDRLSHFLSIEKARCEVYNIPTNRNPRTSCICKDVSASNGRSTYYLCVSNCNTAYFKSVGGQCIQCLQGMS
jgi:hypothetical protein